MFDVLVSADALVNDADRVVRLLVDALGFPEPRETWCDTPAGYGYRAWWCRAQRSLQPAPTRLEVIAPFDPPATLDPDVPYPYIGEILACQGDRPVKTHSTVVATTRFDEVLARVQACGARHRLDAPTDVLPFPRLWLGRSEDDPVTYDPAADGGLFIEVLPLAPLGLPAPAGPAAPLPTPPRPGEIIRVASRGFLVEDLGSVLARVAEVFDWCVVARDESADENVRSAHLGFGNPLSATVQLIEPTGPGPEADFLARWGPGPYDVRLAARDLAAKAADLHDRGTATEWRGDGSRRRLHVDPADLDGINIVFVEATA